MAKTRVCDIITGNIIKDIKKSGRLPWTKPWLCDVRTGNIGSSRSYGFMNSMLVSHAGRYMTYKYMEAHNIDIVKPKDWEERYPDKDFDSLTKQVKFKCLHDMLFGRFIEVEDVLDKDGNPKLDENGNPKKHETWHDRYWYVLWEGYTTANSLDKYDRPVERIDSCEALLKFYTNRENIKLVEVLDDHAYFSPSTDTVHLPKASQFKDIKNFYATAFHEITHSTGTAKRLNRDQSGTFGSKKYAREELVAELGSAFLSNRFGIRTEDIEKNNAAYIQSWIKALEDDHELIIKASDYADKAMKFILDGFVEEPKPAKRTPKPKLTKDELITKMGNIVKRYVKHYKEDFTKYDVKKLENIEKAQAYTEYLWSVRDCGTWLFEKDDVEFRKMIEDQYGDEQRWYTLSYSPEGWTFKRGAR